MNTEVIVYLETRLEALEADIKELKLRKVETL
jgi:hypothetical protein